MWYIFLLGVLFILFLVYKGVKKYKKSNPPNIVYIVEEKTDCTILEKSLVNKINEFRKLLYLNPLIIDVKACEIAKIRNQDIQKEFSHSLFAKRAEILYIEGADTVGENLAFGYKTISGVFNAWKNSKGHYMNLVGNYDVIGISIVKDENNRMWYSIIFLDENKIKNN